MAKWLAILVAVAAVLWGGWWIVGSRALERGATGAIASARASGWDIAYGDLSVAGFPSRFDTTVTSPRVTTPDGAVGWAAPFVQIIALSYRPNKAILVAPHRMEVATPFAPFTITSEDLRASVTVTPSRRPVLDHATLVADRLSVTDGDFGATLRQGQVATRQAGSDRVHDLAVSLADIGLLPELRAQLDPGAALPDTIGAIDIDAQITLTEAPGVGRQPRPEALTLRRATVAWGDLRVKVTGDVIVASDGIPEGTLLLEVEGAATALRLAADLGVVPADCVPLIAAGLAGMTADDGRVTMDLTLAGGQMRLGAIPLGPLPRL
ncbi:DUF2125 domain-containing protein [Jannaschia rubra]|uniref:DUF2125 domain-containing protein n=1 Tax=Jannaschia rubra TaxID=282197 RepID=A0A0M6XMK4_9RHOB|nr:DUF2125 domain-containing protein [Jannaschia rubra]CTQ31441.1 hypothetical protein JAN5088_00199 [Jannaschia rubra]SFF79455.1 hypothetical protein SAMN04488517_101218 [Jannaschia rubra]